MREQRPFLARSSEPHSAQELFGERKEKKGDKHRNPSQNQDEPENHDGTEYGQMKSRDGLRQSEEKSRRE